VRDSLSAYTRGASPKPLIYVAFYKIRNTAGAIPRGAFFVHLLQKFLVNFQKIAKKHLTYYIPCDIIPMSGGGRR
jgi:hypothetical protein